VFGGQTSQDAIDRQTAIDDQFGANVFGLVRCQEQCRESEIPRVAHSPHWTLLVTPTDHLFGAAAVSSDDLGAWTIGVFIMPGRIEFARMPERAYRRAITRVN
jgi:hypothetical protein